MTNHNVMLFDQNTIDTLPWPEGTPEQRRRLISTFIKHGPRTFIDNVDASMVAVTIDNLVLPVAVVEPHPENSWVCSLSAQYVHYTRELINNSSKRWLKPLLSPILGSLNGLLTIGDCDRMVIVNSLLFPTELHTPVSHSQLTLIRNTLQHHYPHHAIVFRSINQVCYGEMYDALKHAGFSFIPSRQVFIMDGKDPHPYKARMFASDMQILKRTAYTIGHGEDPERLCQLYRMIYVNKYSKLNPLLNEKFFETAVKEQLMHFKTWKLGSRLDAMMGYITHHGVVTNPFLGYDTSLPEDTGLYRQINTVLALETRERGLLLNHGAGAASFKSLRRAKPTLEYHAVYYKHLPRIQRHCWQAFSKIVGGIGPLLMRRLGKMT